MGARLSSGAVNKTELLDIGATIDKPRNLSRTHSKFPMTGAGNGTDGGTTAAEGISSSGTPENIPSDSKTDIPEIFKIASQGGVVGHVRLRGGKAGTGGEEAQVVFASTVVQGEALQDEEIDGAVDSAGMTAERDESRDGVGVVDSSLGCGTDSC